jgi:hypothetical protein
MAKSSRPNRRPIKTGGTDAGSISTTVQSAPGKWMFDAFAVRRARISSSASTIAKPITV